MIVCFPGMGTVGKALWLAMGLVIYTSGCARYGFDAVAAAGDANDEGATSDISEASAREFSGADARADGVLADARHEVSIADAPVQDATDAHTGVDGGALDSRPDVGTVSGTFCNSGGWCWENPLPQGNQLQGVHGTSATNVFAAGNGAAIRFDGTRWSQVFPGWVYFDVWASDSIVLWAGLGAVSSTTLGPPQDELTFAYPDNILTAVWGFSATSIIAAGPFGTVKHRTPTQWTDIDDGGSASYRGVWGSSLTDIYAVGDGGTIDHYNGTTWEPQTSPAVGTCRAVWGRGPSDVFVVTGSGQVLSNAGGAWSQVAVTPGGTELRDIWGDANGIVAVGGADSLVHDDGGWRHRALPASAITSVWGTSQQNVWAVGDLGHLLNFDGQTWHDYSSGHRGYLRAIWGVSPTRLFAVGDEGQILSRDSAGVWTTVHTLARPLHGVWADASSVVAVGDDQIYVADSTLTAGTTHGTGGAVMRAVHGASAACIWAVGDGGAVWNNTGGAWHRMPSSFTGDLFAVWVTPSCEFHAVGKGGTHRWGGELFHQKQDIAAVDLLAVSGGGGKVWVAGKGGVLYRSDNGSSYAPVASPATLDIRAIWVDSNGWAYLLDKDSHLFAPTGPDSWERRVMFTGLHTDGLWVNPSSGQLWAVGEAGCIQRGRYP